MGGQPTWEPSQSETPTHRDTGNWYVGSCEGQLGWIPGWRMPCWLRWGSTWGTRWGWWGSTWWWAWSSLPGGPSMRTGRGCSSGCQVSCILFSPKDIFSLYLLSEGSLKENIYSIFMHFHCLSTQVLLSRSKRSQYFGSSLNIRRYQISCEQRWLTMLWENMLIRNYKAQNYFSWSQQAVWLHVFCENTQFSMRESFWIETPSPPFRIKTQDEIQPHKVEVEK